MRKEMQLFTNLQRQDQKIDPDTMANLEAQTMQETVLRPLIQELLRVSVELLDCRKKYVEY